MENDISVGCMVINKNDLATTTINGNNVAISTTVYKVESLKEECEGYISVMDLTSSKIVKLRKDLIVRVYKEL